MGNLKKLGHVFSELNYILDNKQKRGAIIVLIIVILASALELLGVSAILPFVEAVTAPDDLMQKLYIQKVMYILNIKSASELLILMGVALIIIYLCKNLFLIYSYYVQYDYSSRVYTDLSMKMLHSYMSRPYEFFLNVNSAEIMRGCSSDTNDLYGVLFNLIQMMAECLSVAMIGIYLIYLDPIIAVGALALVLVVGVAMIYFFKPIFKRIGNLALQANTNKTKCIYQIATGVKELFVTQRKEIFEHQFKDATIAEQKIARKRDTINSSPDRITEGICVSGIIGIIVIRLLLQDDGMTTFIPKLAAFAMAAFKIFPSVGKITNRMNNIVYRIPALENVYNNVIEAETYDKEWRNSSNVDIEEVDKEKEFFCNNINIKNITWKYSGANNETLYCANMRIEKGQSVGIIGPSGAGKTTLSDILLGILKPQEGNVLVDGVDIFSAKKQWANEVGYVPQNVFLMDDTIRNNVLFGLEDCGASTDDEIWRALEQAQLKSYVENLPLGLDTIVGERGIKFSGGQRQRIAIARALYSNPQLLVLDEATAALDNDTEEAVMEAIESLQGKITMVIVAHRLSTIQNCDAVYEVRDGKISLKNKDEIL